ncbi:MAG TPA: sugar transferase [Candidatus Acidoferrum sp.]
MNQAKRRLLLNALKLFDLTLMIGAFLLATILMVEADKSTGFAQFFEMRVKITNCFLAVAMLAAWHGIFVACGVYDSKRLATRWREISDSLKATNLSFACVLLAGKLLSIQMVTPRFLLYFWAISCAFMMIERTMLRGFLNRIRLDGYNLRFILILGTNPRAIDFARLIERRPELGYRILGFVDDPWTSIKDIDPEVYKHLSDLEGLPEFLRHNVVDEVACFLPLRSFYAYAAQVADLCQQHGILLRMDANLFGLKPKGAHVEEFEGNHHIAAPNGAQYGWAHVAKRTLDVLGSLTLLILAAPILGVCAVLVRLTSPGPIMFMQERVGFNKRRFKMLKFRTMVSGAEAMMAALEDQNEAGGPVFKIKNDPRITRIGKYLRRTSLDELPQLWNVLIGDMSLVGPRPLPVRDYQGFSEDWHRRRFAVRPGLTCLWQVKGRSGITFEQWMALDIQYLDEWSLWLDFKILLQTIPAVLKGSGAA